MGMGRESMVVDLTVAIYVNESESLTIWSCEKMSLVSGLFSYKENCTDKKNEKVIYPGLPAAVRIEFKFLYLIFVLTLRPNFTTHG